MKLKKPKFWDYKKPSFFSYLLLPFSITIGLIAKINSKPKYPNSKIKTSILQFNSIILEKPIPFKDLKIKYQLDEI